MFGGELAEPSERLNQRDVLIWSRCQEGRGGAVDEWECFRGKGNDLPSANWLHWPFLANIHAALYMHTEH